MGEPRFLALISGVALGVAGIACAVAYAWLSFGELRLPPLNRYPAGLFNSVATAFIDEATFRGILLGLLVISNWPVDLAIGFQAVLYALATRLAGAGRPLGMLLLSLGIGLIGGWITLATGGIGAAFLGHVLTRFAIFVVTGHAGQVRPGASDGEDEVLEQVSGRTPAGWEVVGDSESGGPRDYRW
jgi:hypothetical protein